MTSITDRSSGLEHRPTGSPSDQPLADASGEFRSPFAAWLGQLQSILLGLFGVVLIRLIKQYAFFSFSSRVTLIAASVAFETASVVLIACVSAVPVWLVFRWLKPVLPWRVVLAGVLLSRMCGEFLVLVLNLANSIAADSSVRWNEAVLSVGSAFSITGESLAQQYFLVAVDLSTIASLLFLASSLWRANSAVGFSRYLYRTFGLWSCYLFVRVAIKWYVSP